MDDLKKNLVKVIHSIKADQFIRKTYNTRLVSINILIIIKIWFIIFEIHLLIYMIIY